MSITVTDAAAEHIRGQLDQRGRGAGIRLRVETTGCSGLACVLEFVDTPAKEDLHFEDRGIAMYVDPKSLTYLDGTELDFAREGVNEGIRFNNPNVKGECGCGESFYVD